MGNFTYYLLYYLTIVLCPLGVVVVCGLFTSLCRNGVNRVLGVNAVRVTSFIGTPVHEFGHAAMCLLFGHKITDIVWLTTKKENGYYGKVTHSYNPKNIYQRLGLVFIGTGPIFSGLAFIIIVLRLCFPATLASYMSAAREATASDLYGSAVNCLSVIGRIFTDNTTPVWAWAVGLILIAFVCLHLELSIADIKGSLAGMPVYLLLCLVFALITAVLDRLIFHSLIAAIRSGLYAFTVFVFALFMLVILFSLTLLCCCVILWIFLRIILLIIKKIFSK